MQPLILYIHPDGAGSSGFLRYYEAEFLPLYQVECIFSLQVLFEPGREAYSRPDIVLLDDVFLQLQRQPEKTIETIKSVFPLVPLVWIGESQQAPVNQWNIYFLILTRDNPDAFFRAITDFIELYFPLLDPVAIKQVLYIVDVLDDHAKPWLSYVFTHTNLWEARKAAIAFFTSKSKSCSLKLLGYCEPVNPDLLNCYVPDVNLRLHSIFLLQKECLPARIAEYRLYRAWGIPVEAHAQQLETPYFKRPVQVLKGLEEII